MRCVRGLLKLKTGQQHYKFHEQSADSHDLQLVCEYNLGRVLDEVGILAARAVELCLELVDILLRARAYVQQLYGAVIFALADRKSVVSGKSVIGGVGVGGGGVR